MQSLDNAATAPLQSGPGPSAPLNPQPVAAPEPRTDSLTLRTVADRSLVTLLRSSASDDAGTTKLEFATAGLTAAVGALLDDDRDPERRRATLRRALRTGLHRAEDEAGRRAFAELQIFLEAPGAADPDAPVAHAEHATDIVQRAVARLLLVLSGEDPVRLERRDGRAMVDRACGFMSLHISRSLSLPDVVRASDISSRTLQYAFQTRFGMSPMRWLREQRLRRLHAALRAAPADVGVTELAAGLGFTHLGRLGQVFEQRFGLLPRHLLRRARLG